MLTRRTPTAAPTRGGFTLVELLAVIAIIAVLAALTISGVTRAYAAAKRATTYGDIDSLGVALTKFKTEFGFYPPNSFTKPTASTDPGHAVLKRMFPRWDISSQAAEGLSGVNADGTAFGPINTLDANQCMVYFLGGPNGTGWHPTRPTAPSGGNRKHFIDFPAGRLVSGHFLDAWKSPFFYIPSSADGTYDPAGTVTINGSNVLPFRLTSAAPHKFVNQGGFQIISAGADTDIGPGGHWVPGSGSYIDGIDGGGDDLANFNNGKQLGVKDQ